MQKHIPVGPDIPEELYLAAGRKELVPFIGAGVSRLVGYPDWNKLANEALEFFVDVCADSVERYIYKRLLLRFMLQTERANHIVTNRHY